jgi:hypothetical protein
MYIFQSRGIVVCSSWFALFNDQLLVYTKYEFNPTVRSTTTMSMVANKYRTVLSGVIPHSLPIIIKSKILVRISKQDYLVYSHLVTSRANKRLSSCFSTRVIGSSCKKKLHWQVTKRYTRHRSYDQIAVPTAIWAVRIFAFFEYLQTVGLYDRHTDGIRSAVWVILKTIKIDTYNVVHACVH